MSLNQVAELGGTNKRGGIIAGGYEPSEDGVPVPTKARKRATTAAITKGEVITIAKTGADRGKIRTAVAGDFGPFGMAWLDKAVNDTRVEFISREGVVCYLIADGTISPGMPVMATTGGKVIEVDEGTNTSIFDMEAAIVGYCEGKAIEVSKRASGTETPSVAVQGDIVAVKMTNTGVV